MKRASTSIRKSLRTSCCWLVTLALLNSQAACAVSNSMPAPGPAGDVAGLYSRMQPLDKALDRSQVNLEEKLFALEFDPDRIVRFVSEDVRFQGYTGLLRGAEGALISRAGNALDQSVLLAKLLNDAGYEARIAAAPLPEADARRLLQQMTRPGAWPAAWTDKGRTEVEALIERHASPGTDGGPLPRALADEVSPAVERLHRTTGQALERIREDIAAIAGSGSPAQHLQVLIEEARDYFWVEYRVGAGNEWQPAHPAFADAEPPTIAPQRYMAEAIPAELQHRIRIEVKMNKRLGDSVEEASLMSAWERPAANAAYQPLAIGILPYTGEKTSSNQFLTEAAEKAKLFVVTFNENLAPGAQVFTLQGDVLPLDALSASGEFIKQVTDKGAEAVSALSGLGLSEAQKRERLPPKRLERLWIDYTLIAPGGQEQRVRRHLLDTGDEGERLVLQQVVEESDWLAEARAALLQARSLTVATGPVNPAWLTDRLLQAAEDGRATLQTLERRAIDAGTGLGPEVLNGLDSLPDTRWIRYLLATQTATGFHEQGVQYLNRPLLVSFNHGVRRGADELVGYDQIDLLFNERRALTTSPQGWTLDPLGSARAGVFETYQEHRQAAAAGADRADSAFRSLAGHDGDFARILPGQHGRLDALELAPGAHRLAKQELDAGYALLVPQSSGATAWWRIDPASGTATGMGIGAGGYGGVSAAEYITVTGIIIGTLLMYYSFYNCFQNESGLALFCCLVDSWLTGLFVAALAFVIAQLASLGLVAGVTAYGGAAAEAELVAAILSFIYIDGASTMISFTDFRIRACGSATGT